MTHITSAKIAGSAFLIYIVAGIASMVVFGRAASGVGTPAKLIAIAQHPEAIGIVVLLGFVQSFAALILAATLYAITRVEDPDLAILGMICRVSEGVIGGYSITNTLALLALATTGQTNAFETGAAHVLGAYLLRGDMAVTATFFAVGSALFSFLFLRGRMIPVPLAWLGVVASVLLVICLPLQAAGFLRGLITSVIWLPMLVYEVPLGLWLIVKGVATPQVSQSVPSFVRG